MKIQTRIRMYRWSPTGWKLGGAGSWAGKTFSFSVSSVKRGEQDVAESLWG